MLGLCKGFLEVSLSCTHSMHKWDDFLVMALSLCRFVYFVIGLHSSGFNIVGCRRNAVVQPWLTGFAVFRNRQCVRRCGALVGIGAPAWEMCAKTSRSIKWFLYINSKISARQFRHGFPNSGHPTPIVHSHGACCVGL
jgi:hypothetical protein